MIKFDSLLKHAKKSGVGIVLAAALIIITTQPVLAQLTPEQRQLFDSGIRYFNSELSKAGCQGTVPVAGNLDRFLQVLSKQESGGNPTAQNPNGSASGKYQYVDGTWKGSSSANYPPGSQYAHAKDAPEEVQDAVAYLEYTKKFKNEGGDLFRLAVSHYLPKALSDEGALDRVPAGGNTMTPREYANMLLGHVADGYGSDVVLKYAAAPDFQTWLTEAGGAPEGGGASGASGTTATASCETAAGDFVFYSQYDPKWKDHAFGSSTIGPSGCGPSSVAMVVATLADKSVTPVETADFGTQNGGYIEGSGSSHQKMLIEGPEHWGLKVESLGLDMNRAIETLKMGGLIIVSGSGPIPFTTGGHIIVIRGISAEGKLLLGDPAHPEANTAEWEPSELVKSMSAMFGVTK